ncbi:VWA domain-containing protein [Granulicella cerasi]|uniref:VWA domain-containing protein n=1 Tax=Granulicella cerasi TaxID=741063 RepID=A0ABW1Z8S1_9BACT|nr:VWA domain-containing protein [Granulicella cerasi]
MMSWRVRVFLLAACMAAFVGVSGRSAAQSQQPDGGTLHVTTQLVVLDVVVTDKKGNLVQRKLTQDDFKVFDNGVEQRIRHFEGPDEHQMPPSATPIVKSAADLSKIGNAPVTILVLDELNTRFEDSAYSRQMMVKYLQTQPAVLPQATQLLVATSTTFQELHDYTQDRDALIQIVKKHMPGIPFKADQRTGAVAVERMAQVMAALQQIAQASTGTAGRKNLLWVGLGFPSASLDGMDDGTIDTIEAAMRRVTSRLLAARVTLYTIDPSPGKTATIIPDTPDDLDMSTDALGNDPMGGSGSISFTSLADSTGGMAFRGRNDIENVIGEGISKGRTYYTLAYVPNSPEGKTDYHKTRITLNDKALIAVTREGYYAHAEADLNPVLDKAMDPKQVRANLQLDLSSALTSALSYNGLALHVQKTNDGHWQLHVDEKGIAWSDPTPEGKQVCEATIAAAWYDAKGKIIGHAASEETYPRGDVGGAEYHLAAEPQATARRIRFVVRDARNGRMGTADVTLP